MAAKGEATTDAAESVNLCMCENFKRENREILLVSVEPCGMLPLDGTVGKRHRR